MGTEGFFAGLGCGVYFGAIVGIGTGANVGVDGGVNKGFNLDFDALLCKSTGVCTLGSKVGSTLSLLLF